MQEVMQDIAKAKQHENTKAHATTLEKKLGQLQELIYAFNDSCTERRRGSLFK
jgi:hypothetical protein